MIYIVTAFITKDDPDLWREFRMEVCRGPAEDPLAFAGAVRKMLTDQHGGGIYIELGPIGESKYQNV